MNKKGFRKLGVGLLVLVILLTAGWLINQQRVRPRPQPAAPRAQLPVPTASVTITSQGFIPQTILVKKDSTVTWTNQDNKPHQVSSDPHPTHSLIPALGKGKLLPAGSSQTFTFTQPGTFTYHDEQNPLKFKGTIVVK